MGVKVLVSFHVLLCSRVYVGLLDTLLSARTPPFRSRQGPHHYHQVHHQGTRGGGGGEFDAA